MVIHRRFAFLAWLFVVPPLAACSGADAPIASPAPADPAAEAPAVPAPSPEMPSPASDAGPAADGGPDSPDRDAGRPQCNALVNVAEDVPIVAAASEPPPAAGGAIADGVYVVRVATLYTGPGGAAGDTGKRVKMTLKVAGAQVESVFDGVTRSAVIAVDGETLRSTSTCPSAGTDDVAFSATATTLALYLIDNAGTRVYSLEKL
jgi:hypothetical protein